MIAKAELHCHIEGAAPPDLVLAQARRYGVDATPFIRDGRFLWHDFTSFLAAYDFAAGLFRSQEDYARLAETYLSGLAADGAIHSEIFVSPDHAAQAGLAPHAYIEALGEGMAAARARTGIEGRMIVVGVRHFGAASVEAAASLAAGLGHPLVSGFGMAGDERAGHASDFTRAFAIAREAGLGTTVHAGELAGWESVAAALDHLEPDRIGHGVRAVENAHLVARLAEERITLELCPGSNVALGIYSQIAAHPFALLMRAGCKVTLNSDDPPYFATSLAHEYAMAARHFGLDEGDLNTVTRNAIEAAFVDDVTRGRLLDRLPRPTLPVGAGR